MDAFDADTDPTEALRRVVHEVYAVEPAEFVAVRKEWVARLRKAGLREVAKEAGALRKPSVSAAAINALVRAEDPVVQQLQDVGSRMRHAQSALDAAGLAALRGERDELLRAWVAAAQAHAPTPLAGATEAEVRDTAIAALADADATDVVVSGHLTRALSYSGFGEVDVADAVARTSTGVVLTRIEGGAAAGEEADTDEEIDDAEPAADGEEGEDAEEEFEEEELDEESEGGEPDDEGPEDDAGDEPADDEPEEEEEEDDEDDEVIPEDEAPDEEAEAEPEDEPDYESESESDDEPEEDADDSADEELLAQLARDLDEAEKGVAAARAGRKKAADDAAKAEQAVKVAKQQVAQAERLLASATKQLDKATAAHEKTTAALAEAEEELSASRDQRDAAKVALEEAEDA